MTRDAARSMMMDYLQHNAVTGCACSSTRRITMKNRRTAEGLLAPVTPSAGHGAELQISRRYILAGQLRIEFQYPCKARTIVVLARQVAVPLSTVDRISSHKQIIKLMIN